MPPTPQRWTRALLCGVVVLLAAAPALAREYSVPIDVSDEEDLRELYYDVQIDEEEFRILLLLLENPIDVNRSEKADLYALPGVSVQLADAIVEERILNGPYVLLADLLTRVEGVTWRLLDQIEPFVYLSMPQGTKPAVRGKIHFGLFKDWNGCPPLAEDDYAARSKYRCQLGYDKWPTMGLGAHVEVLGWLDFAVAGQVHEGVKKVVYDPASRDIYASYGQPLFEPIDAWLRIRRPHGLVIVGGYHADFGAGLVMGTDDRERHGFSARKTAGSPRSYESIPGLFGAAAQAHSLQAGRADFDLSIFGSIKSHDLYSPFMRLTGGDDSVDLLTADLEGPRVWIDGQRSYSISLPDAFRVALAGGNATVRFNRRTHVGVTGYGAFVDRTSIEGVDDPWEFVVGARWPTERSFGTIGLDGAVGFGLVDFEGEAAFFLAQRPAMALYFRARIEPAWGEFTLSARHYDIHFANPFAHGEAASDQLLGYTDRNEQAIRFAALYKPNKRLQARGRAEIARNILLNTYDFRMNGSLTGRPLEFLALSGNFRFTDQNLALGGRDAVYSGDFENLVWVNPSAYDDLARVSIDPNFTIEDLEFGEQYLDELRQRAGQKLTLGWQVRVDDKKIGDVTLRYRHSWTDNRKTVQVGDDSCQYKMQQSHSVRLSAAVKPHKTTTLRGSAAYHNDDVQGGRSLGGGEYGDKAVYGYVQVEQKVADKVKFKLRGLAGRRLGDPPSACDEGSADRFVPDPEAAELYAPTDYQTRLFGEILFVTTVKF